MWLFLIASLGIPGSTVLCTMGFTLEVSYPTNSREAFQSGVSRSGDSNIKTIPVLEFVRVPPFCVNSLVMLLLSWLWANRASGVSGMRSCLIRNLTI